VGDQSPLVKSGVDVLELNEDPRDELLDSRASTLVLPEGDLQNVATEASGGRVRSRRRLGRKTDEGVLTEVGDLKDGAVS
jgi:hypothetical protein